MSNTWAVLRNELPYPEQVMAQRCYALPIMALAQGAGPCGNGPDKQTDSLASDSYPTQGQC